MAEREVLLDTNILGYAADSEAPQHKHSLAVVNGVLDGLLPGVLVPQVLLEFYSVVTNRRVARPLSPGEALMRIQALRAGIPVLMLKDEALDRLAQLAAEHQAIGPGVYDVFLVAQMLSYGVRLVCTYDRDFNRINGIEAVRPEDLLREYGMPADTDLTDGTRPDKSPASG